MFMNDEEENLRFSLSKFESMLKTNKVLFFDKKVLTKEKLRI